MSFAGHVLDMIIRGRENRELRKHIMKKNTGDRPVISSGTYKHLKNISYSAVEDISRKIDEKLKKDRYVMDKYMTIFVFAGVIVAGILLYILRKTGIL